MRTLVDSSGLARFMKSLGQVSEAEGHVYFTGGATAVLYGWRDSTIDVDIQMIPDRDDLLRAIPQIKEDLRLNVELAAPSQFIPVPSGWEERSPSIAREGLLAFHHFELVSQALAKAERGHTQDREDIRQMLARGLVGREAAMDRFEQIEPLLFRFPAIDPKAFRRSVEEMFGPDVD